MPVYLDAIPDKTPDIRRPVTRRWIILGVIIFLVGIGGAGWLWQGERVGQKFWFTVLVFPTLIWGSLFTLRRIGYKLERVGMYSWNKACEQLVSSEIARGQNCSWLVGEHLVNFLETGFSGEGKTHLAAVNKTPILEPAIARDGVSLVRHAPLPVQGRGDDIIRGYVPDICGYANNLIARLPTDMPCYLAFEGSDNLTDLSDILISGIEHPLRRIRHLSGLRILDYWLDHHHDIPAALLIVSAQINDVAIQDSGEAITVILLCNRSFSGLPSPLVRIHRPEICTKENLSLAMERAILWAKMDHTAPLRGWLTGGELSSDAVWSNACEISAPMLTMQRNVNIDIVVGYAGSAAPWQSLILAARQCRSDNEPQMVVVETAPSCHQLCAVTSAKSSGIV